MLARYMRIKERRFSVPFCATQDGLKAKPLALLCILFSNADFNGHVRLSYSELSILSGIPRRNTIHECFTILEKRGWIFHRKRTNTAQSIWIQIPPRYRSRTESGTSIIQEVPFR